MNSRTRRQLVGVGALAALACLSAIGLAQKVKPPPPPPSTPEKIAFHRDYSSKGTWRRDIFTINTDGTSETQLTTTDGYLDAVPNWSPVDGAGTSTIVYVRSLSNYVGDLWLMNKDGANKRALTTSGEANQRRWVRPCWCPDGAHFIAANYGTYLRGESKVYLLDVLHGGDPILLLDDPNLNGPYGWSADLQPEDPGYQGKLLVGRYREGPGGDMMWFRECIDIAIVGESVTWGSTFVQVTDQNDWVTWSPDGSKISALRGGGPESEPTGIWVVDLPDPVTFPIDTTAARKVTSLPSPWFIYNAGDDCWSPDGNWIAFAAQQRGEDGRPISNKQLFKVNVDTLVQTVLTSNSKVQDGGSRWSPPVF